MKIIYQLSEIDNVAATVISNTQSNLLLFNGEMGVGKTTLIKALIKQLGSNETAVSPTFSIVNEYRTIENKKIYHFDLYRLEKSEEVFQLGFEEYLSEGDWIFIEWPELITAFLPEKRATIEIKEQRGQDRTLELKSNC